MNYKFHHFYKLLFSDASQSSWGLCQLQMNWHILLHKILFILIKRTNSKTFQIWCPIVSCTCEFLLAVQRIWAYTLANGIQTMKILCCLLPNSAFMLQNYSGSKKHIIQHAQSKPGITDASMLATVTAAWKQAACPDSIAYLGWTRRDITDDFMQHFGQECYFASQKT